MSVISPLLGSGIRVSGGQDVADIDVTIVHPSETQKGLPAGQLLRFNTFKTREEEGRKDSRPLALAVSRKPKAETILGPNRARTRLHLHAGLLQTANYKDTKLAAFSGCGTRG